MDGRVQPLERSFPEILEPDASARDHIVRGRRHDDLPGLPLRLTIARAGVHHDPARLPVLDHLDLPEVDAGPDLDPQLANGRCARHRTSDRIGRGVEAGEEAVPGRVPFVTSVASQLGPDQTVVA